MRQPLQRVQRPRQQGRCTGDGPAQQCAAQSDALVERVRRHRREVDVRFAKGVLQPARSEPEPRSHHGVDLFVMRAPDQLFLEPELHQQLEQFTARTQEARRRVDQCVVEIDQYEIDG